MLDYQVCAFHLVLQLSILYISSCVTMLQKQWVGEDKRRQELLPVRRWHILPCHVFCISRLSVTFLSENRNPKCK